MAGNRWLTMTVSLMFSSYVPAFAQGTVVAASTPLAIESRLVTVNLDHAPLLAAIHTIAGQANLNPVYDAAMISEQLHVTMHIRQTPVADALRLALQGTGLVGHISADGDLSITRIEQAILTSGIIMGTVIDARTKQPVHGAKVELDDGVHVTVSADNGTYRLPNVSAGPHTVTVKLLGYTRAVRTVTVQEDATVTVAVGLEPSTNVLEQVVVTGMVIPTELKAVPNAITVITAKQIQDRGITQIDQLFRGDVPGLFAVRTGAEGEFIMFSRGASAFANGSSFGSQDGTNPIKTYIDGVELADPTYLTKIDPASIERIEILAGPQASTIYGSNAINGVMQIFTKRGRTAKPELVFNTTAGWTQNNLSSALAPTYVSDGGFSGVEGPISYNLTGSVTYQGSWTPAVQGGRQSASGGVRVGKTPLGIDLSIRRTTSQNRQHGDPAAGFAGRTETGETSPADRNVRNYLVSLDKKQLADGTTAGMTVTYAPLSWWSHQVLLGYDDVRLVSVTNTPTFSTVSDTSTPYTDIPTHRQSGQYVTTLLVPLAPIANITLSTGGDYTHVRTVTISGAGFANGALSSPYVYRSPIAKTHGGFLQGQLGIHDALFATYGVRAEWSPTYGANQEPNLTPRYGMSYVQEIGPVTAKLRASYGRATRPPSSAQKDAMKNLYGFYTAIFGDFDTQLANPELGPEFQQGGEGGVELYFGQRASLQLTRYNQTVDGLIDAIPVFDSVRSLQPVSVVPCAGMRAQPDGYCYYEQTKYVNIGSIRNQGWESQASVNTGPLTTSGTYSWVKSRVIGITPKYRNLFGPAYAPGASFAYLAEHTWAMTSRYALAKTMLMLTVNGTAQRLVSMSATNSQLYWTQWERLQINKLRISLPYVPNAARPGYIMMDLNATRQLNRAIEGTVQIHNLTDRYDDDFGAAGYFAVPGRETRVGLRVRF